MANLDQCPSSAKDGKPVEQPRSARQVSQASGKTYWRSLDDLVDTSDFREFLEREFPKGASELLSGSRRHFLRFMGASVALAGAASMGCRRPDHKILAYHTKPEEIVPGKPLFYATSRPMQWGGAEGLLVETYEGRPTKLEGNPLHPYNNGVLSVLAQASVLNLYDPSRLPGSIEALAEQQGIENNLTPWDDFLEDAQALQAELDAESGTGLVLFAPKITSPALDLMRERVAERWPQATWISFDPTDRHMNAHLGYTRAFRQTVVPRFNLSKADTIFAIDSDCLGDEADLVMLRGYGANRLREDQGPTAAADSEMSRVYAVESDMTLTGGQADHRLCLREAGVRAIAIAVAKHVIDSVESPRTNDLTNALNQAFDSIDLDALDENAAAFAKHCAEDLIASGNRSAVIAGANQPAAVHALAAAINAALGAIGTTVELRGVPQHISAATDGSLAIFEAMARSGKAKAVITLGVNPIYAAPAGSDLKEAFNAFPTRIHLGELDETGALATHLLPGTHFLEAWSDALHWDGTYTVAQPMIKPLHKGHSDLELLAALLGDEAIDGYNVVRSAFKKAITGNANAPDTEDIEKAWRRTLHDGVRPGSAGSIQPRNLQIGFGFVARSINDINTDDDNALQVNFKPHPFMQDGLFANNGWMQELPHSITKVAWENPLLMSLETAKANGIRTSRTLGSPQYNTVDNAVLTVNGQTKSFPVWISPGLPANTVIAMTGNGREVVGKLGEGIGANAFAVRPRGSRIANCELAPDYDRRATLIANTQDHWSMEGRALVREVDLPAFQKHGDKLYPKYKDGKITFPNMDEKDKKKIVVDSYGKYRDITFAGRFGNEGHTPANRAPYTLDQQHYYTEVVRDERGKVERDKQTGLAKVERDSKGRPIGKKNLYGKRIQQWGMTIDLSKCTGCSACTIACQAENNIPVVGKTEVAKGREMSWIRIDRYFGTAKLDANAGVGETNPDFFIQPVACVHCENAPCEVVCPVNATVHGREGTNNMAYNRCIGTRYCSNNCPYKVRRFNWFDYAVKEYNGSSAERIGIAGEIIDGSPQIASENFIPPRLREKIQEVRTMQYNPHVTVRSRGLMEKCTYCIQRVNAARVESKLEDLPIIPDGYVKTACQAACPTQAITFGDIYDYASNNGKGSKVHQEMSTQRAYGLLAYLNTRPRTLHLMRLRNPNKSLLEAMHEDARVHSWEDPFHGEGHGDSQSGHHSEDHKDDHEGDSHSGIRLPILNNAEVLA